MHKRYVVATVAVTGILSVPAAALFQQDVPRFGTRAFKSTHQTIAFRTTPVTTSDTRFRRVPGLDDVLVQNRGPASALFSGDFSGGPVQIRVIRLPDNKLLPGVASFAPTAESSSFSYNFLDPRRRGGIDCRTYAVSWRSPTGAEVTLNHATLAIDHRFDDTNRKGLRKVCVD